MGAGKALPRKPGHQKAVAMGLTAAGVVSTEALRRDKLGVFWGQRGDWCVWSTASERERDSLWGAGKGGCALTREVTT